LEGTGFLEKRKEVNFAVPLLLTTAKQKCLALGSEKYCFKVMFLQIRNYLLP
jgi:hypothetical protein